MQPIPLDVLKVYRARSFRTAPGLRIQNINEAIAFVNERGFIYFWPIRDILLPSLWAAVAGDRPVADAHDDPGHVSWGWKDSLLGKKSWYYGKILRQKATIISLETAPYFYALSENYGAPEEDYQALYQQGRLTAESKTVYETLLDNGPMDSVALRRAARLSSKESDSRFNRALTDLQSRFLILPIGVADAGAWHYAFTYDIVARHFPELLEQARFIGERQARQHLAGLLARSVGAVQVRDLVRLFGWSPQDALQAIADLQKHALLIGPLSVESLKGDWYVDQSLAVSETHP